MSITMKTSQRYLIGLLVLAALFAMGSAVQAYHFGADKGSMSEIKGEITAIDLNHNTISVKSSDVDLDGKDFVVRLNDATKLVSKCDSEVYSDASDLKVGDMVMVSYYEINDRFFADMITPSGYDMTKC